MIRGIDLRGAVSVNMITMIGIGPLITLALVLSYLNGPLSLRQSQIAIALPGIQDGSHIGEADRRAVFVGDDQRSIFLGEEKLIIIIEDIAATGVPKLALWRM